jgi:hypothetical protein
MLQHWPIWTASPPKKKRRQAEVNHAHFPANVADFLAGFDLPQGVDDLFFGVPFSRHLSSFGFRPEDHIRAPDSTFRLSHFRVLGHSRFVL